MCSRFLSLLILSILSFIIISTTPERKSARFGWNPKSKALLEGIKYSTRHKLDSICKLIDIMTKKATRRGSVRFRQREKDSLDKLDFRAIELERALAEIQQMEESREYTFTLEESLDSVVDQKYPHKDSLKYLLITVKKWDTAHALHEILHGYQTLKRDVIYVVNNGKVERLIGNGLQSNIDVEVPGYRRQFAHSGYLGGWFTPPIDSLHGLINKIGKKEGTDEQANIWLNITKYQQITHEFVRSRQKKSIGHDPYYK